MHSRAAPDLDELVFHYPELLEQGRSDVARLLVARGELDEALELLEAVRATGALDLEELRQDKDFAALADDPRFEALVAP